MLCHLHCGLLWVFFILKGEIMLAEWLVWQVLAAYDHIASTQEKLKEHDRLVNILEDFCFKKGRYG